VIGGDSGGAPDAILAGESGYVVSGVPGVAVRITELLTDPAKAKAMGEKGRAWVDREWREELPAARLATILAGDAAPDAGLARPAGLTPPQRRLRPRSASKAPLSE
jgi:glycosyltransferase involved in cell wall biosynthesis